MGDTGSLALGGALGAVAVATKHEIVLLIVGGLFVVETVSVIVQVFWYKRTGTRVFLMAPLHHHFEKKGWAEPTIVIRFWIISMILALVGLATLEDPMSIHQPTRGMPLLRIAPLRFHARPLDGGGGLMPTLSRADNSLLGRWWWTVDRWTLGAVGMLIGFGYIMMLAASPAVAERIGSSRDMFILKQVFFLAVAGAIVVAVSLLSPRDIRRVAIVGCIIALALTAATW